MTDDATNVSLSLSREEFASLFDGEAGRAVAHLTADLPTTSPLSAYAALSDRSDYGFLLESAEKTPSSDPDGAFAPGGVAEGTSAARRTQSGDVAGQRPAGRETKSRDGADADRHARYSFVGYDPEAVVTVGPDGTDVETLGGRAAEVVEEACSGTHDGDVLDRLRTALPDLPRVGFPDDERQRLRGGLVGFLAYEAVYDLWLEEVGVERPDSPVPDAQFVLTTRTLSFDHAEGTVRLVFTPVVGPDDDPDAVYDELRAEARDVAETLATADGPETDGFVRSGETAGPRAEYEDAVRRTKQHVLDGDIYQGVISRVRELRGSVDPVGLYEALRAVNPSPYMYLLRHDDRVVVGASPETLVSVQGRRVVSNPIAGTCARGTSPVEDRRLAGEMLADAKERAEHTMLVDLARNDVRRVSEPGSVRVEEFMNVLKYSHVQHIESTVTGTLAGDKDAFDATRATFPAGTLTGAPKVRAMEIIDELELTPRGVYGGGVGYYSWSGDADFAIVIRTATVRRGEEDTIAVRAGAGIVADSDPTAEYEETEQKMGGVLAAVERIEREPDESAAAGAGAGEVPR